MCKFVKNWSLHEDMYIKIYIKLYRYPILCLQTILNLLKIVPQKLHKICKKCEVRSSIDARALVNIKFYKSKLFLRYFVTKEIFSLRVKPYSSCFFLIFILCSFWVYFFPHCNQSKLSGRKIRILKPKAYHTCMYTWHFNLRRYIFKNEHK